MDYMNVPPQFGLGLVYHLFSTQTRALLVRTARSVHRGGRVVHPMAGAAPPFRGLAVERRI